MLRFRCLILNSTSGDEELVTLTRPKRAGAKHLRGQRHPGVSERRRAGEKKNVWINQEDEATDSIRLLRRESGGILGARPCVEGRISHRQTEEAESLRGCERVRMGRGISLVC